MFSSNNSFAYVTIVKLAQVIDKPEPGNKR